jgi:hypothetical protein
MKLSLETKVNIVLILLVLIILFHIVFLMKPDLFNFKKWLNIEECEYCKLKK